MKPENIFKIKVMNQDLIVNPLELSQTAKYLTKENIASLAPSVFSTKPSSDVSSKYTHIPTEKVIDDMEQLGWKMM